MNAPVYRTIERPTRLFGLELFDAVLWCSTLVLFKWTLVLALCVSAAVWLALFALRYRRPPRFLLSFLRFHAFRWLCRNRFSAAAREPHRGAWLPKNVRS